jgi:hypothetical protein
MAADPVHAWLLRLCDPEGCHAWPERRLDAAQAVALLQLAEKHGVAGAVLANLSSLFADGDRDAFVATRSSADEAAVDAAIDESREAWFIFMAGSLAMRQRTGELLDTFRARDIPAVVIKGEDFADRLYSPPGLRPFRDIDLMLPRERMADAAGVMAALGYREVVEQGRHASGYGEQAWDSVRGPDARVELHWNLITSPAQRRQSSLPFEALFAANGLGSATERVEAGSRTVPRAAPAAMLLIAAVHAVLGHRFDRLQHLCDIRQICRGAAGAVDVDWLREAAGRCRVTNSLAGALEVTARLLADFSTAHLARQLGVRGAASIPWRLLVGDSTLLRPTKPLNKLRRTAVREWMKRAA